MRGFQISFIKFGGSGTGTGANGSDSGPGGVCNSDGTVNSASVNAGIAQGIKVIDALMTNTVAATSLNVKIDLAAEIGPSNYEGACAVTGKQQYIAAIWHHFATTYPSSIQKGSMSAIPLATSNAVDAGNPLRNLINGFQQSGDPLPSWFSVHPYDVDGIGYTVPGSTLQKLQGVYQVYSEFGFLSNQATPKETVIGEIHLQDVESASEINTFLSSYSGTRIGLSTIADWPLRNPISNCSGAFNVPPPYKTTVYNNILVNGLTSQQAGSTLVATPDDPVVIPAGQSLGSTTLSWNASGYSSVGLEYSVDGGALSAINQFASTGSTIFPYISSGHSYTFLLKPVIGGTTQENILLDSVTVNGLIPAQKTKFIPIVPVRLMDTRQGRQTVDGQYQLNAPLAGDAI